MLRKCAKCNSHYYVLDEEAGSQPCPNCGAAPEQPVAEEKFDEFGEFEDGKWP